MEPPSPPSVASHANDQGLYGQTDLCWEAAGDLRHPVSDEDFARGMTWDVRLALALLEATSSPQIGGKFWSVYGRLLPQPHTVTVRKREEGWDIALSCQLRMCIFFCFATSIDNFVREWNLGNGKIFKLAVRKKCP